MKHWVSLLVRCWLRADVFAIVFLVGLPLLYFFPVTLGQKIWYGEDVLLEWIPFGTELSIALREGRLPLWATGMMNGFPLLAEGQVGALYPLNIVLYRLLPAYWAVSYQTLLHILWASCGMYVLARAYGYHLASAVLAALVFSFNGFVVSHLIHLSFITTLSWLPWVVFLNRRFQIARQTDAAVGRWFLGLAIAIALQLLSGFPQIAFLTAIIVVVFGLFDQRMKQLNWRTIVWLGLPWIFGAGIAAIQLIPTFELAQYSERLSVLGNEFSSSYALPPTALVRLIFPLALGMPNTINNEHWSYVGVAPLVLALLTILFQRNGWPIFIALFALSGLLLAVGNVNPLFPYISALPILNYFRAPARFMLFFVIAAALLSAHAFHFLSQRLAARPSRQWLIWAVLFASLDLLAIGAIYSQSWDFWVDVWVYLPWGLGLVTLIILLLAWTRHIERRVFQVSVIGLAIFDLACCGALFFYLLNPLASPAYVLAEPRAFIALEKSPEPYRVFTDGLGAPSFPTSRNALSQNVALIFRKENALGYTPLEYEGNRHYFLNLKPAMLNLYNARYVFVPLEPTHSDLFAPRKEVRLDLTRRIAISPTLVSGIEIVSFTQDADDVPQGFMVARLIIETDDGQREEFPLRVGIETADWDYERKVGRVAYDRPKVAYSFPAFWRSFGRDFTGYTYVTRFDFRSSVQVVGIELDVVEPDVHLNIVAASLFNKNGQSISLAQLSGKNDFIVRFLSDTVAVWENLNYLPRVFIVHNAESFTRRLEFYRIQEPSFDPRRVVLLDRGPALSDGATTPAQDWVEIIDYKPESVRLVAQTDRAGYLVLLDSWYPGWRAFVDGREVPVYRANFLFRAIPLEPGEHSIVFELRPLTLYVGAVVSALCFAFTCLVSLRLGWKARKVGQ
jgi:hypothetical protein